MKAYEYRHVVTLEETNLLGNVYYLNHLRWQGQCRELFLREEAPEVLQALSSGELHLVTTSCSCTYLGELFAFDEVIIRMYLHELTQNRITVRFEYWRKCKDGSEELVARGEQEVACMRRIGNEVHPALLPESLRQIIEGYSNQERKRAYAMEDEYRRVV